jgi:hypothetical protein
LQQRRQRHRRRLEARQKAINNLCQAGRFAAVIVLLWFMWQLPATKAYFTDRDMTQATFRSTSFAENLLLYPGSSKTNDSPGEHGPAFAVAQIVAGQIYLDFGTYPAGNNRSFPHVLTLKNTGNRTLTLRWHLSGPPAQHFETQDEDIILVSGTEVKLAFKLDTDPADAAGEYIGTLHLSALDDFITGELPVRLRLAASKSGKEQNSTVNTVVYNSSGPAVSESVYQSPDSNHPTSQAPAGADGQPEVLESVYQDFGGQEVCGMADNHGIAESIYLEMGADGKSAGAGDENRGEN